MAEVYCITNRANGMKYVGVTTRSGEIRFREHCTQSRAGSKYPLHEAMREFGIDAFELSILESGICPGDDMYDREAYWVNTMNSYFYSGGGYNLTRGGYGTRGFHYTSERNRKISEALKGVTFSQEHRDKLSKAMKGNLTGSKNPFYGRKHSISTKIAIAHANCKGSILMLNPDTFDVVKEFFCVNEAARWLVDNGYATGVPNSAACVIGSNLKDPPDRHKSYSFRWRRK